MSKYCLVTGSGGLVGSESVKFFCNKGYNVIGIDNDMRAYFFGTTTKHITEDLVKKYNNFEYHNIDIRKKEELEVVFSKYSDNIECIIHCAAQPSHDWAAKEPETDFSVNATATLYLLELARKYCIKASFIYMSTNKVYGDNPNNLELIEYEKRYDMLNNFSIDETMSIDNCKHSIFGVSKLAADIMVQEYGRYFNMNTVSFRGGCITGPNHQGAQLHGFLSYLVKCIMNDEKYTIFGYKGKQVRDNIHSYDLVNAFWHYHNNPKPAAVYNMGGGRDNAVSILETIDKVNNMLGKNWANYTYNETSRSGDHQWYISDLSKFKKDYPEWSLEYSIDRILKDIICSHSNNVITANLMGGVGNQLFQVALAYTISRKFNMKLEFESNQFGGCRQGSHPSKYYKSLFEKLNFVDKINPTKVINEKQWAYYNVFNEIKNDKIVKLNGYYQSDKYFKEYASEIKKLFTPEIGIISYLEKYSDVFEKYPELKQPNDYCFIGIRRGDYITYSNCHNPCGKTYYNKAINIINKDIYYIMTDDINWVKQNYKGPQYRYLEITDDLTKLLTITLFKNYIISNSTFYWWGSYLSIHKNIKIIAPDKWINLGNINDKSSYVSIYRDEMQVLERPVETN